MNKMRSKIFCLALLLGCGLAFASGCASAQSVKSENLFYMTDTLDALQSFRSHAAQVSIIVPYVGDHAKAIEPLIQRLRKGDTDRWLLRSLQRYTVNVRRQVALGWLAQRSVEEIGMGIGMFVLIDGLRYDTRLGLLPDGNAFDASSLVS